MFLSNCPEFIPSNNHLIVSTHQQMQQINCGYFPKRMRVAISEISSALGTTPRPIVMTAESLLRYQIDISEHGTSDNRTFIVEKYIA